MENEHMSRHIHACISYIACRLISGKRIASLYDDAASQEINIKCLLKEGFLKEFDEKHKDYLPGFATDCSYRYTPETGCSIEIFINEKTFIVHVCGSPAYFIGNVRGETVYLYDHKNASHFRYRISSCLDANKKGVEPAMDAEVKGKREK